MASSIVCVEFATRVIPTYLPGLPDKNPMFLDRRVYQGSSGKVYPLPFTDSISNEKIDREWQTVVIENDYLRVVILPELGGRIHELHDKANGYECIYHQRVIKPALVGLAGPWISGGIEFNWPQHHRPATFLPVQCDLEENDDGSKTVWCSDHDPLTRMKGAHGICLHPDRSYLELKVRVFNRTSFVETFLWWANAGVRVHECYQSFFPPDVKFVADHARRAISSFPLCEDKYYGIDYGRRAGEGVPIWERPTRFVPAHLNDISTGAGGDACAPSGQVTDYRPNDLSWYANIPTPCSYMAIGSEGDFFGGYDHKVDAGILHVADHHIAPGKKQWTWGNHEFGYAWDRHLSDDSAPYVELMAGVFTDNQPDFSFLIPGETRSWSQFWYPIQKIGVPRNANADAAVSLNLSGRLLSFGIQVNVELPNALVRLSKGRADSTEFRFDLSPAHPLLQEHNWSGNTAALSLFSDDGREIISTAIISNKVPGDKPESASEPPLPAEITSNEVLYLVGLHLEQYRHATRSPVPYWRVALERDPLDSKCNNALGLWHMRRGEFETAETHFRNSIQRLTARNANSRDGESFYNLGVCLRFQSLAETNEQTIGDAYSAFFKATWNKAWAAGAYLALAEIDCCRNDFELALEHINSALDLDLNNLKSWSLRTLVLRRLGSPDLAEEALHSTLRLDPLDACARYLSKGILAGDLQSALDVAHDLIRAGLFSEAEELLLDHLQHSWNRNELLDQSWGAEPLVWYTLGWIQAKQHKVAESGSSFEKGASISPDYCFPNRLEEIAILKSATASNSRDARAPYYLGNLYYARGRHEEAIKLWKRSARIDPDFSIPWRNSGIAEFNDHANPLAARRDYDKAFKVNPKDGRVLFELDQLAKRSGERPRKRLERLSKSIALVKERDDLSVEISRLYNLNGQPEKALEILNSRQFKPWEGGEGQALSQYVRSNLALGRKFLLKQDWARALDKFQSALTPPDSLGEVAHLLANQGDIHFWIANALALLDRKKEARSHWSRAASFEGDFQQMAVTTYSEMTFYSVLSLSCLHQQARARKLAQSVFEYSVRLEREPAKIDYFATSLPDMLVFDDDFKLRKKVKALFLRAQASFCLGRKANAGRLVRKVLQLDPNHELASSFASEVAALQLLNK